MKQSDHPGCSEYAIAVPCTGLLVLGKSVSAVSTLLWLGRLLSVSWDKFKPGLDLQVEEIVLSLR